MVALYFDTSESCRSGGVNHGVKLPYRNTLMPFS
jgi:hypothetical protein